jgi:hypothetical protein
MEIKLNLSYSEIEIAKEIITVLQTGLKENKQFKLTDYGKKRKDDYITALDKLINQLHS